MRAFDSLCNSSMTLLLLDQVRTVRIKLWFRLTKLDPNFYCTNLIYMEQDH